MSSESLVIDNQVDENTWLVTLSNSLPLDYMVVISPMVQRVTLPAVIVGPQDLVMLHPGDSKAGKGVNIAVTLRKEAQALRSFMNDEFPALNLTIRQLVVILHPEVGIAKGLQRSRVKVVPYSELAADITRELSSEAMPVLKQANRETIAKALLERQLSRNHRASEPFVFRGGNLLGTDRRAWTLSQVFRHMDRYRNDGIFHLENGTLEQWLHNQGALDLATLVGDSSAAYAKDSRAALEIVLVKSGMVRPRALVIRPSSLDLGSIIAGETQKRTITIHALKKRDFLAVTVESRAPWLEVEPSELKGISGSVEVRVNTAKLSIQDKPYETQVVFTSPHIANATILHVQMQVVGEPSHMKRLVLRPLIGLITFGLIGVLLGLAMSRWGMIPPRWLSNTIPGLSPDIIWGSIFGLFWAVWGVVRGLKQPQSHSELQALLVWLANTALWMIPFGALALTMAWALGLLYPLLKTLPTIQVTVVLVGIGLAIVPSVIFPSLVKLKTGVGNSKPQPAPHMAEIAITIVVVLLIIGGLFWLPSFLSSSSADSPRTGISGWVNTQISVVRSWYDHLTEQYYLTRYDRRAPLQATPVPSLKATPLRSATPVRTQAP
jgi:hypothetical protein